MASYQLMLRLCGFVCQDCPEPLKDVTVRLYRATDREDVAALAAAKPKTTFRLLDEEAVAAKEKGLLAEGRTDEAGRVDFGLGGDQDYDGGPVEIDVVIERFEHQREDAPARQFTITVLQPVWRRGKDGPVAAWDYCLPHRQWCWIRGLYGAYTICGRVTHCESDAPVGGVKVLAFDRDWLQDDPLGEAVTDGDGRFRIDYSWSAFQPGTFIDVELFGGPDVYFRVETAAGTALLDEPPARGREPDRQNAGPCLCVDLCLAEMPPQSEPLPVFTHVGNYRYAIDIDSAPGGTGLTNDSRAFYSTMCLNGVLAKTLEGVAMEYRFEVRETDATGGSPGAWTPVAPSQIGRTVIGVLERWAPDFPGDPEPVKTFDYTVNGGGGELVASIVDGWIRVPQESDLYAPSGHFVPNGNMIALDSTSLAAWGSIDLTGLETGNSATAPPVSAPLAQDRHFSLRMRVRKVGSAGAGSLAGTCLHIAIVNTRYDNIRHHPSWMEVTESNAHGVAMVDVQQLLGANGCEEIGADLDVLFTAEHPNLGAVSISMTGPGGPYGFTLPPAATPGQDWFGTATPNFVVADLEPCAYIVTLSVQLLLTTGDSVPDNLPDQIAFCKA